MASAFENPRSVGGVGQIFEGAHTSQHSRWMLRERQIEQLVGRAGSQEGLCELGF